MSSIKPILGLDDAFGHRAKALRTLQFKLREVYEEAGFSEVIPPLVERPEALNSGAGSFLSDQTVVFTDPADAGLLAIRPDMTPQIARIVATRLRGEDVLKLHYSGQIMLARPDVRTGSRQQWQTGVECLGLAGVEGDVEVIHLAALSMVTAGFDNPVLQVGHMALITALIEGSDAPLEDWVQLIARYSPEDLNSQMASDNISDANKNALKALAMGEADVAWLQNHQGKINSQFDAAAQELLQLVNTVQNKLAGEVDIVIDAAVTPRFLYHNGMVFSGFASGSSYALLHGGRYDKMMAAHGRDMPAVGFSFDLWAWLDT
ncbi:MAG TPA: ATP phosphoribosyltransferase regulatory subunit [Ghiorsea sp.]|nr:ATP phosphoribosyltransferase regulatory subunit [Ghiorsea sp.]HIP07199.1 ATP phosphoribosyltransferase regulatory subunit [Mariprofundaceae bacterium]